MADEERPQDERTEEATPRRLQKAREDGQVPRSQELPAAAVMIFAVSFLFLSGEWLMGGFAEHFLTGFVFDRRLVFNPELALASFARQGLSYLVMLIPLLLLTMVVAVLASSLTGGFVFSWKAAAPKLSKFNLISGLKRMFGLKALVELIKAVAKFVLVAGVLYLAVRANLEMLNTLGLMEPGAALARFAMTLGTAAVLVTLTLVLIAMIDVPYQRFDFAKRMRMAKQDIKDEQKDVEGRPEVRAAIRRRQREMAMARMMDKVKHADVVITNPAHYAVALAYDPERDVAPTVVASGVDSVAQRIREEAEAHGVQRFEAPELARALYYLTEVGELVPENLYEAVAQVVSYVFGLRTLAAGETLERPRPTVPPEARFDTNGQPMA